MELLNRYLHAVGEHLPAKHRADTLAELRANLEAEIEGREEQLGRSLTDAELAEVLEAHGMPVIVAARYGPQQFLIGPQIFPFYWHTLKRSFPYVVGLYALVQVITAIAQSADGQQFGAHLAAATLHFPMVALTFWAIMTIGFAIFELAQGRVVPKITVPCWSAADLPPVEPPLPKDLSTGHVAADLIVSIALLVWLLMVPNHPYLIIGPGARILHGSPFGLTPEWHAFYWQIIALLAAMLPLKVMMMLPALSRWRRHLQLAVNAIGIGVLAVMVTVRTFFVPGVSITPQTLHSLSSINQSITLGFEVVLAISVLKWLWDAAQLVRCSGKTAHGSGYAAVK